MKFPLKEIGSNNYLVKIKTRLPKIMEKTVSEAIIYRRSTRIYKDIPVDPKLIKQCIKQATLAPNSSNLQLWEFYHITDKNILSKIASACFDQNASKTAQQLLVVITRKDLWKQRAKANLKFIDDSYGTKNLSERDEKRKKRAKSYYGKLMPFLYTDFLGILGFMKYIAAQVMGLFKPMYRQTRLSDMRIVAHKSAGLAAQNFMISMAGIGYDTCPMEGSDTLRVKQILNLPRGAEINMIIGCGVRDEKGIYGPQFRVPFENVYKEV
jgi:nitroreductase